MLFCARLRPTRIDAAALRALPLTFAPLAASILNSLGGCANYNTSWKEENLKPEILKRRAVEDFEVYQTSAKVPDWWKLSASRLKRAADCLKATIMSAEDKIRREDVSILDISEDLVLFSQYAMLIGLALENLLKAKLVEVAPDKIRVEKSKPDSIEFRWGKHSHDLWDLFEDLKGYYDLELTAQEEEMLCNLTVYVLWKGRYPAPQKSTELPKRTDLNSPYLNDYDLIDRLYQRINGAVAIRTNQRH